MTVVHPVQLIADINAQLIPQISAFFVEILKEMALRLAMTEISQTGRGVCLIVLEKSRVGSVREDPLHKTMSAQRSAEMACLLEPKHVMTALKIMKDVMMTAQGQEMGIFALKIRLFSAVEFKKILKIVRKLKTV